MGTKTSRRPIAHINALPFYFRVEALTEKLGDGGNILILRSMGKWLEYRVSYLTESSLISCLMMMMMYGYDDDGDDDDDDVNDDYDGFNF